MIQAQTGKIPALSKEFQIAIQTASDQQEKPRERAIFNMRMLLVRSLFVAVALVLVGEATPNAEPSGCVEDALLCPNGGPVLARSPKLNCDFPPCPTPAPTAVAVPQTVSVSAEHTQTGRTSAAATTLESDGDEDDSSDDSTDNDSGDSDDSAVESVW